MSTVLTVPDAPLRRLPELDLLRFAAASSVVLYHYTYHPVRHGELMDTAFGGLGQVTRFGYLGVDLFFMISGFVILWSSEKRTPQEFIISRVARLYPSFWVCVLITAWMSIVLGHEQIAARTVAVNLTMVPSILGEPYIDGVYWTLFVELKFYTLVTALLATGALRRLHTCLYLWLAALTASAFGLPPHVADVLDMYPLGSYFLSGCLLFTIGRRGLAWHRLGALVVSCALCVWTAAHAQADFMRETSAASTWAVSTIVLLFHVVFLRVVMRKPGATEARKYAYWLGSLTYPLYLLHNRLGKVLWNELPIGWSQWSDLAAILVAIGLLSTLVAAVIERRACAVVAKRLSAGARHIRFIRSPEVLSVGEP